MNKKSFTVSVFLAVLFVFISFQISSTSEQEEKGLTKQELIKRIASILEACLLTKQHSINDIASGLAGVTILDPRFLRERAEELLSHVFLHQQYGMNLELCNTIRNNMVTLYRRLLDSSSTKSYREILLPFEALSN